MIRKILPYLIIAVIIAVLAAVLVSRTNVNKNQVKNKRPDKPLVVEMSAAKVQPMPILLQAVGQVQSEHSVQVRPQVSGMLKTVDFTEGQTVRKGQRLFSIDSAPYETALAGARAAYASAKAQVERLAPLAGKEYVTGQEYDNARASAGQLQAMFQQAEINLAYTEIRAPIAGRTGSLAVRAGNLIAPADSAPLVVINQMQPILVQYTVPQQQLAAVRRYQTARSIRIYVTNEDGSGNLGEGDLVFIDNSVNTDTGTVLLKARVKNEREQLWPGQYVGVRTQFAVQNDAVVVPQTAVQSGQNGNFVYLVEQGAAAVRPVRVDRQIDDFAVIAEGLQGGEQVVTRAPRNLRPGSKLTSAADAANTRPAEQAGKAGASGAQPGP